MADTAFAFTDPRAQTKWAQDTFEYALQLMRLLPLVGTDGNSIIHVNRDLTKQAGGDIIFKSRDPLTGAGQGDGGSTIGNEQALEYRNMSLRVHTRMTATKAEGQLALQVTDLYGLAEFRKQSREKLGEWQKEAMEKDLVTAAAGLYNENSSSSSIETINEAYPTAARSLYLGQTVTGTPQLDNSGTDHGTDALLTAATEASNLFGTLVIDRARSIAVIATPRIRPAKFHQIPASQEKSVSFEVQGGDLIGDFYVCLVNTFQFAAMRSELGGV